MNPEDWDDRWLPCPEGWEGRYQFEHETLQNMLADIDGGIMPSFLMAKYGPALGWVPATDLEKEKSAHRKAQASLDESEAARQQQGATINKEREHVDWDHLEPVAQRRLMTDAGRRTVALPAIE
jgi:hypothetical protein